MSVGVVLIDDLYVLEKSCHQLWFPISKWGKHRYFLIFIAEKSHRNCTTFLSPFPFNIDRAFFDGTFRIHGRSGDGLIAIETALLIVQRCRLITQIAVKKLQLFDDIWFHIFIWVPDVLFLIAARIEEDERIDPLVVNFRRSSNYRARLSASAIGQAFLKCPFYGHCAWLERKFCRLYERQHQWLGPSVRGAYEPKYLWGELTLTTVCDLYRGLYLFSLAS